MLKFKCIKDCLTCPAFQDSKCELDAMNQLANAYEAQQEARPLDGPKGDRQPMRWLASDWNGRAEDERSPELMGSLISLPNSMDRWLDESSDFFVIAKEAGSGPSELTRIVKRREEERLHHPLSDLEEPDEEDLSEDVMDHAIIVPLTDEGEPIQDYEPGPTVPMASWDLVFEIQTKFVPVDVDTGKILSSKVYEALWNEYQGDLRGIVTIEPRQFEASTPLYFMPKFRNHKPTPEIARLIMAIRDRRIDTPIKMFKAMNRLKTMLADEHKNLNAALPDFRKRKSNQLMGKVMHAHKEHMKDKAVQVYKPEVLFFMFARRLWDFFHKVYQKRDPKAYGQWIARKTQRALEAKNKKGGNKPQATKAAGATAYPTMEELSLLAEQLG